MRIKAKKKTWRFDTRSVRLSGTLTLRTYKTRWWILFSYELLVSVFSSPRVYHTHRRTHDAHNSFFLSFFFLSRFNAHIHPFLLSLSFSLALYYTILYSLTLNRSVLWPFVFFSFPFIFFSLARTLLYTHSLFLSLSLSTLLYPLLRYILL